jgi:KaiC/GvpD/RAD55 family RecA-like ATPase
MGLIMSTYISDEEQAKIDKEKETYHFYTRFNFLSAHFGIRPSENHLIVGTSGSGKSTLARSIAVDCATKKRVLFWASEESKRSVAPAFNKITRDKNTLDNITIYSELDMPKEIKQSGIHTFISFFQERVMCYEPDIIFIDNLTTSYMYSDSIGYQGQHEMACELVNFANKNKIPIFMIAHTKKGIVDNQSQPIDITDIRGNTAIANAVGYGYILQNFKIGNSLFPYIYIHKHRHHEVTAKYYSINFEDGVYNRDREVDFKIINEAYQKRNRFRDKL